MRWSKTLAVVVSLASLVLILTLAALRCCGSVPFETYRLWTNIATLVWFATAPFWLWPSDKSPV
ncbi:MAG: hypothetical protein GXO73_13945 [Calditrichaeota bacterium]|nr:hypothetical protein [Calditrichota bacterium]